MGGLTGFWKKRGMTTDMDMGMLETIVVPTVLYGSKSWVMNTKERRMVEAFDMKCLRKVLGVGVVHRIRNRNIRGRRGNMALSWKEWFKVPEVV